MTMRTRSTLRLPASSTGHRDDTAADHPDATADGRRDTGRDTHHSSRDRHRHGTTRKAEPVSAAYDRAAASCYRQHRRKNEQLCGRCREAQLRAQTLHYDGRRQGDMCGTSAGYAAHLDRGECACWTCREAQRVAVRRAVLVRLDAEIAEMEAS